MINETGLAALEKFRDELNAELTQVLQQINHLRHKAYTIRYERDKVTKRLSEPRTGEVRNGADLFVVRNRELAPFIRRFIDENNTYDNGSNKSVRLGGQRMLAVKASIATKTIRTILKYPDRTTTLNTADRILTAAGQQEALTNGSINIVSKSVIRDRPPVVDCGE